MTSLDDAYKELGLKSGVSFLDVRSKYIELAKKHHPDRLTGKSQEEISENEEKFKRITNAYQKIIKQDQGQDSFDYDSEEWLNKIWIFFKDPEVWDNIKDIIDKISKKEDKHIITVKVTLEEIHNKKIKKLRLFLKNIKDPVFCELDCSRYPGYLYSYSNTLDIQFYMNIKNHDIFRYDDIINTWDLYTIVKISWYDYINGLKLNIKYLDYSDMEIVIHPFPDFTKTIIEKGKGLCEKGDLYICYEMTNICKNKWNLLDENKKNIFLNALKSLV